MTTFLNNFSTSIYRSDKIAKHFQRNVYSFFLYDLL